MGSLSNNNYKYIKYNDLLEIIGSDLEIIESDINSIESDLKSIRSAYNKNNKYIHIVEVISTIDKSDSPKDITIRLYKCIKAYTKMNIKEIIYIGINIDMNSHDIILDQSKVIDFIPKMYKQGNRIAELLINNNIIESK